jgi:hypothetical protein
MRNTISSRAFLGTLGEARTARSGTRRHVGGSIVGSDVVCSRSRRARRCTGELLPGELLGDSLQQAGSGRPA